MNTTIRNLVNADKAMSEAKDFYECAILSFIAANSMRSLVPILIRYEAIDKEMQHQLTKARNESDAKARELAKVKIDIRKLQGIELTHQLTKAHLETIKEHDLNIVRNLKDA